MAAAAAAAAAVVVVMEEEVTGAMAVAPLKCMGSLLLPLLNSREWTSLLVKRTNWSKD